MSKPIAIPVAALPDGIPTFRGRHGRFVWPPAQGPTLLLHQDFDLLWVLSGHARVEIADQNRLEAIPGDTILLPPRVPAVISQLRHPLVFWHVHFDFRASASHSVCIVPLKLSRDRAGAVRRAYETLNTIDAGAVDSGWRHEAALIDLLCALAKNGERAASTSASPGLIKPAGDPRVAMLRERIERDPAVPWRVAQLAASVDLSPGHLHSLWIHSLGSGVKAYIVRARLAHAMALLREPAGVDRPSIKQVASAAGFSSQHLFCRQFKMAFGVTPSAFRDSAGI